MEAWTTNRGKYNYPVTAENIHLFRQMLREVSLSSPHWDEYPPPHEMASVDVPRSYKRMTRENKESEECNDGFSDDDGNIFDVTEDNEELEISEEETHDGPADATMSGTGDEDNILDEKVSYLLSLAAHTPPQEREKYVQTVLDIGTRDNDTIGHDNSEPFQRAELFEQAVVEAVTARSKNTMQIEDLAHMTNDFGDLSHALTETHLVYISTTESWAYYLRSDDVIASI
jgi:hypothetical protein